MFRMNGMPRAHDCRDVGGRAMQEQLPRDAQERPGTFVGPGRLRVAHPCAQSRSTVHPEHNTLDSVRKSQGNGFEYKEHANG